jgi:aspartate aminotransferase
VAYRSVVVGKTAPGGKMPASPEIREAIRQGSWIRKMFADGAVLKAERGEENVFDFTLGNP